MVETEKTMTRIILIRHCEAEGNHKRVFQGHTDADISENGKIQLELLSLRCRNMEIDALYSSPLRRAYQTAEAVNRYHGLPIQIEPGLIEINGGCWEGRPWSALPELYPEESKVWSTSPHDFSTRDGESMLQVYDRIWDAVLKIVRENPGRRVAAVSHGCAIRNFLCRALGRPIRELNEVDWCDNTAVSIVDFDGELCPHVELMNDASHLTESTSTFSKQTWWKPENRGSNRFE